MNFRKDINGLRAIAIIGVVIFHFYPSILPGGFTGVDVFFVISGYLMTRIIIKAIEQNTFSIIKFYLARANRIIPPLAILCIGLLVLGFIFLTSWDFRTLGRDIASSITFFSNVIFSMRSGYFEVSNIFLLHTWSLSTEWQFYMLYPILIIALKKMPARLFTRFMFAAVVFGFAFGVYATLKWPVQSFFLLPMRGWEMLFGGIICLSPISFSKIHKKILERMGLFLTLLSYFLLNETVLWPGFLVLLPVMGAGLVILSARDDSLILNNGFIQSIGKWSYSIYLWHWPIVVCFSYYGIPNKYKFIGISLSLLLGYLSYILVEKNKFFKNNTATKNILIHFAIILTLASAGSYVYKTGGISSRDSLESNSLIQGGTANNHKIPLGETLLNTGNDDYDFLLLGDSNAGHYIRGILQEGTKVKLSWLVACLSFPTAINKRNGYYPEWKEACKNNFKLGFTEPNIIISQSWTRENDSLECANPECNLSGDYHADLSLELSLLFKYYTNKSNIYLISELPKPEDNIFTNCLKTKTLTKLNLNCKDTNKMKLGVKEVNKILKEVSDEFENVHFIDMEKSICDQDNCTYSQQGKALFMPNNHLSGFGSEYMWAYIISEISSINVGLQNIGSK